MASPLSLAGLRPFLVPYRVPVALAGVFLVMAAAATLAFPWALRRLIDDGLASSASDAELATGFLRLFGVAVALARSGSNVSRLRIALTGTNSRPFLLAGTEAFEQRRFDDEVLRDDPGTLLRVRDRGVERLGEGARGAQRGELEDTTRLVHLTTPDEVDRPPGLLRRDADEADARAGFHHLASVAFSARECERKVRVDANSPSL